MEQPESFNQTKLDLENKIKAIFFRNKIRVVDIVTVKRLIKQWVKLTKYKINHEPIDDLTINELTMDNTPKWSKE